MDVTKLRNSSNKNKNSAKSNKEKKRTLEDLEREARIKRLEREKKELEERERIEAANKAAEHDNELVWVELTDNRSAEKPAQNKNVLVKGSPVKIPNLFQQLADKKEAETRPAFKDIKGTVLGESEMDKYFAERKTRADIANEEVNSRYGAELYRKKKAMDDYFNAHKDPKMGNTIISSALREEYMLLKNDYETTKKEADQLRKEIMTFGDVNVHVAGELALLGIDNKLKDLVAKEEAAKLAFQTYLKNPLRVKGDKLSRTLAQNQINAETDRQIYENKLERLANYISALGLPKDYNQLPNDIKDLLKTFPDFIMNVPDKLPEDLIRKYASYAYDQLIAKDNQRTPGGNLNNIDQDYAEQMLEEQKARLEMYEELQDRGLASSMSPWGLRVGVNYRSDMEATRTTINTLEKALTYKKISDDIQKAAGIVDKYGMYASLPAFVAGQTGLLPYITDAEKFAMRIAKGAWDKVADFDTWTGLKSMDTLSKLNIIDNKIKDGKKLTKSEQDLLNATAVDDILHSKYADYEKDTAYKWGQISGESVPFMVDFILTNGWKSAMDAGLKVGGKYTIAAIKNGLLKFGKEELSFLAKRRLLKSQSAINRVLSDATYALAVGNTIQLPRTMKNIYDIHLGNIDYVTNDDNQVVATGFTGGEDWGRAIYLGEGRQFVENFTEQMGEWGIGKFIFSPLTKVPGVGKSLGKLGDFARRLSPREYGKFIRDISEKAQIGGYFGEVAEEYYGIPLNHILGTSEAVNEDGTPKTFLEDLTDPEQMKDILGGIGVSMLTMGMIGAGNYYYHRNKFNYARTKAQVALGDDFEKVENAILDSDYTNVTGVASHLITTAKSKVQANAIRDYYTALMGYRGASITQQKKLEEAHSSRFSKSSREAAYREGYDIYDEVAIQDYERAHQIAKLNLMLMLNLNEDEFEDADLQDYAQRIVNLYEESEDPEDEKLVHNARAALAYLNINSTLEGARQKQYDNLKIQMEEATKFVLRELVDDNMNVVTAKVKGAKAKDSGVYIIRGDVTKDKKVLVYNRNTGVTLFMDSENIDKESVEAHDVNEVIASNQMSILQRNLKYTLENLEKLGLRVGDKHTMEDGKVLTVLGPSRDGGMLYQIAEPGSNTGIIQQQPNINSFNEFIANIQEGKARQIYEGRLEDLSIEQNEQLQQEEEPTVNIAQVIADETRNSKSAAFVPVTKGTSTTAYVEGLTKKDALNTHKLGKKLADYAKDAKSFSEFLNTVKNKEDVVIEAKYIQRLRRMYNAFKKGNITKNMFGLLFVPSELREMLNTQKWGKRFEDITLDDDGNVIKPDAPKPVTETETALRAKIEQDKAKVLEDQTTSHDYFILDETGKRRMWSRVHSAIGPQKKEDALTAKRKLEYKEELTEAYEKGIDEFKKIARRHTNGLVKIDQYLSYIEENPGEAEDVIEAVASLAAETTQPKLKSEYEGKLIFIQDGGGKSTIKKFNKDVVDSDDLLKELAPDGISALPQTLVQDVLDNYEKAIRDAVALGKTVLTGNINMLKDADVVIYNSSAENTVKRTSATDRANPFTSERRAKQHGDQIREYLEQNPDVESYELRDDLFASDILTKVAKKPALVIGTLVDDMFRELVQKGEIDYDSYITPEGYPMSHYMNKLVFDSFVKQMKDQVTFYNNLGWTLIAEPIYLYSTVWDEEQKRNVRVAGVTDVIAIDETGVPHIIDFKTSQYGFDDSSYTKTFNGYNYSSKEFHSRQLSMYSRLSSLQLGYNLPSIEVLGIRLSYDTDLQINQINIDRRIELTHNDDILDRFTAPSASVIEELKKRCETVAEGLRNPVFVPAALEGISTQTAQMREAFVTAVQNWLDTFASDKLVEGDYKYLLKQYADLFEQRLTLINAINTDNAAYLHNLVEAEEEAVTKEKHAPIVNEDAAIDSLLSELEKHMADLRAAFEANMQYLRDMFTRFRQEGWDVLSADIPEDIRRDLDKVLANINKILQELPVPDSLLSDFFDAKLWLSRKLGINGGNSSPVVPKIKTTGDIPAWLKINTTKKADTENAVSITDPTVTLSSVSTKPDFMNKAKFTFTKNGLIIYLTVNYGGHTFTPIRVFTGKTPQGKAFYDRIIDGIIKAGDKDVHPTKIRRTYGKYKKSEKKTTLADKKMISTKRGEKTPYIYDIEFSPNPIDCNGTKIHKFGVVRVIESENGVYQTVVTVPGETKDSKQIIYAYSNSNENRPKAGTIVYMHEIEYDEVSGTKLQTPIIIDSARLTEGDAKLVLSILRGECVGDLKFAMPEDILKLEFAENGEKKGLTCREVLGYLIPYGKDKSSGKPIVHLEYDQNDHHIVHVVGRIAGSDSSITEVPDISFNIFDNEENSENGAVAFVKFLLQNVTKHIDIKDFARKRLGDDPRIRDRVKDGKTLKFGNSTIVFDQSDVLDSSNSSSNSGLSGFAWYLKRGFLETNFDGMDAPLFEFPSDCDVKKDETAPSSVDIQNTENNPIDDAVEVTEEPDDFILLSGGKMDASIDQEVARKRLRRILGNFMNFDNLFVDNLEKVLHSSVHAVGACTTTAIYLTDQAEAGDEYHEAFHWVVELLFPESFRKKVYEEYRKAKNLSSKTSEAKIREGVADDFKYYLNNIPTFKLSNGIKELFNYVKRWAETINKIGSWKMFMLYNLVNFGAFRFLKPRAENIRRLNEIGALYKREQPKVEGVMNLYQYKLLVNTLALFFLNPEGVNTDWYGVLPEDIVISKEALLNNKYFKAAMASKLLGPKTLEVLQNAADKFEEIAPDVVAYIHAFSGSEFYVRWEEENTALKEGIDPHNGQNDDPVPSEEEVAISQLDQQTRASYEFDPFTRTTQRVRWFFAGITNCKWRVGANGKVVPKAVRNTLGLPQLMNPSDVYALILNTIRDVRSPEDILELLKENGKYDPVFDVLAKRFEKLYNSAYLSKNPNADDEALISLIYGALSQNKNTFDTVRSKQYRKKADGTYYNTFNLYFGDESYTSNQFVNNWSLNFASGGCRYITKDSSGKYKMANKPNGKPYSVDIFIKFWLRFGSMSNENGSEFGYRYLFSPIPNKKPVVIKGRELDVDNPADILFIKDNIIQMLNLVGISFTGDMFDYMLQHKFGDIGKIGLEKFFNDSDKCNIMTLCHTLTGLVERTYDEHGQPNGYGLNKLKLVNLDKIFNKTGFALELAKWKYEYEHATNQLMVLATNNNKFYVMSENNLITDRLVELQDDKLFLDSLEGDNYVVSRQREEGQNPEDLNPGKLIGSLLVKHVHGENPRRLKFHTLVGFKTDQRGDMGIDYAQINDREDYIAKMELLVAGGLLFPTMSDKKTYGAIFGCELPGLKYGVNLATKYPEVQGFIPSAIEYTAEGIPLLPMDNAVLDQFIEYWDTEYLSVDEYLNSTRSNTVDNFDTGAKVKDKAGNEHVVKQGGRLNTALGVYVGNQYVSFNTTLDENGNYVDEESCRKIAYDNFFSKSKEEKRRMIQELISRQLVEEMDYLAEIGLLLRVSSTDGLLSFQNVGLDQGIIDSIANQMTGVPVATAQSMAIAIFVNDIFCKNEMSSQEVCRVFSGNTIYFGNKYNDNGQLKDITTDWHKRLGGIVSTGQRNNLTIPGMPEYYSCAEVDDYQMVPKDIEQLKHLMYKSELLDAYQVKLLKEAGVWFGETSDEGIAKVAEIYQKVHSTDPAKIEEELGEDIVKIVKKKAANKASSFEEKGGVNVTDGAAYISDKMCENLLRQVGAWSEEIKIAFKILRGEEVDGKVYGPNDVIAQANAYQKVITTVIGTQKYTAYGFRFQDGKAVPYYNKMALFPVFKCIATGNFAKIYKAMLDQEVDMVMMKSAVKTGSQNSKPINWDEWHSEEGDGKPDFNDKENGFKFNKYYQKYSYLRKQFNTDPKDKELMKMGTQMTKVALSTLRPGNMYKVGIKEYTADEMLENIMGCLNKLSNIGLKKIKKRLFKEDGETLDVKKFSDFLIDELSQRGASLEMLNAADIVTDRTDEDGNPVDTMNIPMDAMANMNWIQSIIAAAINDETINANIQGKAFYQRSVWAMEGSTQVLGDEDIPPSINNGNKLRMKNENGSMDCVLSIDFFTDVLKQAGLEKASFEKQRQWLLDHGIIGGAEYDKEGNLIKEGASPNMLGYRIPTQAVSSIHALRCVDVLPVVRDTVILPEEFTTITGSDFDIDKLYISSIQYKVDHGTLASYETDSPQHVKNELIRNYIAVLCDTDNAMHMLHAPIDKDTELLTDIVKELNLGGSTDEIKPFSSFALRNQSYTKTQFIAGKFGIGPFALNNNSLVLTMLYGVEFKKDNGLLGRLGMTSLHEVDDRYGKSIMSWLSGLINAHVDVAKDPYITRLGVNSYTYNLVNLMIRVGFGKDTFYFTTQPIMRKFAFAHNVASGVYMLNKSESKTSRIRKEIERVWKEELEAGLGESYKTFDEAHSAWSQQFKETHNITAYEARAAILTKEGCQVLKEISAKNLKDVNADDSVYTLTIVRKQKKANGEDYEWKKEIQCSAFDIQMLVADANEELNGQQTSYAQSLADLVKYAKIDTEKQGNTVVQQRMYQKKYKEIFIDHNGSGAMFEPKGLSAMASKSFIDTKTLNAINAFTNILSGVLIEATPAFYDQVQQILEVINKSNTGDEKIITDVVKALKAKIKSEYFFAPGGYCDKHGINAKSLVTGDNTIYDRLIRILSRVLSESEDENSRLALPGGVPKNYLLKVLVTAAVYSNDYKDQITNTLKDDYEGSKFVKILNFLSDDTIDQDLFTSAWEELLNDDEFEEGQNFARDLIVYAMMTSGDNGGRFDLFKYVPNAWKTNSLATGGNNKFEESYAYFMYRKLLEYQDSDHMPLSDDYIDDIILNNWHNEGLVPTISGKNFMMIKSQGAAGVPLVLAALGYREHKTQEGPVRIAIRTKKTEKGCPKFVKMARSLLTGDKNTINGQRQYVILEHIDDGTLVTDRVGFQYPIYQIVDPKGVKFNKGETIYSYDRNDSDESEAYGFIRERLIRWFNGKNTEGLISILRRIKDGESMLRVIHDYMRAGHNDFNDFSVILNDYDLHDYETEEDSEVEEPELTSIETGQPAQQQTDLPGPETKINIHAGAGDNAVLSNFAERPFDWQGLHFDSVEQAFQITKLINLKMLLEASSYFEEAQSTVKVINQIIRKIQSTKSGAEARKLGKTRINSADEDVQKLIDYYFGEKEVNLIRGTEWNRMSSRIMKILLRQSFQQNPQALQRLLATGNATLTHLSKTQQSMTDEQLKDAKKEDKWIEEFPRLLMEVREELRLSQRVGKNTTKPEFYSGAADGADKYWGAEARALGIKVKDYTGTEYRSLSKEWKDKIEKEYVAARDFLGKPVLPIKNINSNTDPGVLTRRDMMLADKADAIFAVVEGITKPGESESYKGKQYPNTSGHDNVKGGTANAVARGIIRGIPVYVYDQSAKQWKMWDSNTNSFVVTQEPTLTPHAATIGTRGIDESGKQAIRNILKKSFGLQQATTPPVNPAPHTYRPQYKFGKIYLTEEDRKHITERIRLVNKYGDQINADAETLDKVLQKIGDLIDSTILKDEYVTIPYREWKQLLLTDYKLYPNDDSTNQFEYFVQNDLLDALIEEEWIDRHKHGSYDAQTKQITLDKFFYNLVKILHDNVEALDLLLEVYGEYGLDSEDMILSLLRDSVYNIHDLFEYLQQDSEYDEITPEYSYSDDRQLELFGEPQQPELTDVKRYSDVNNPENKSFDPGSIESVVAESLTKPDQQEVQQPDENGEILGRLGVDKSQLIALLGNTMYTANVQQVAEKELVLNAFDAVKIAMSQGAIQKGQIEVSIDNSERTISISDNGSGMTPEIVQKAFFTIGGSYKGDNVDNRLKSGGLGLAKMAFLFTADYVELTTVKDGKKTYTKATPQQIQNDDFKIVVTNTSEPNGTTVTVKIPETYRDQEGNEREIWFSSWGKGFFDNPMIGNVEVTKKVNGRVDWEEDFNKIPEGYTFIGTATSDFGEIEIYKDFSDESDSVDVLISGLYQFTNSVYTWNDDGTHYRTIVNILPSVGTKSEVYPINNQREGFRATVDPEIKDLKFFLKRLDTMFEKKKLKASFGTSFNMSPEQLKQITPKSTTSTADLILEVLDEIKAKYKQPYSGSQNDGKDSNFGIPLSTITEERKESEKIRKSSFDASSIPILDLNTYVDTTNMDITKPVFHNNTDFLPSDGTVKFLTEYGGMMIQLRDLFLRLHSTSKNYQRIALNAATQYWGISLDKTYNGVNVSPRLFNFLGLNPIGMVEMLIKEDVVDDFEYVLEELLFHNLLHEINHNAVGGHGESFTVQFQYTYSEFAKLGKALQEWRQGVRNLILEHLKDLIKDAKEFEHAHNVGDALEGRSQRRSLEESEENSAESDEQTTEEPQGEGNVSEVSQLFINRVLEAKKNNSDDSNSFKDTNEFPSDEMKHCKGGD